MPRFKELELAINDRQRACLTLMVYQITYQKNNETHYLEWIAPSGWSTAAVRECFEQRFPNAELVIIAAQS